jgi:hypothetical protein
MVTDAEFERLVEEGKAAAKAGSDSFWRLGDLALRITEHYSRENGLQDFADRIGVHYKSLWSYSRVAKAFPESSRRLELPVTWSHHWAVAGLKDRDEWVKKAEAEGWSVRELIREATKGRASSAGRANKSPLLPDEDVIELASDNLQAVVVEARRAGGDAEERLAAIEGRLFDYVVELNQMRLDDWYATSLTERELEILKPERRRTAA